MAALQPHRLTASSLQRIAIVRALPGLGDLLCLVPTLRALRSAFPNSKITLIGLPWAQRFVKRFAGYLDRWIEFPGYPGIPEVPFVPQRTAAFLAQMQAQSFDLALQLHGSGCASNPFTQRLGAQHTAGFFVPGQVADAALFLPYPDHLPEVRRSLRLLTFLGIPLQGDHLEFPLTAADWAAGRAIVAAHRLQCVAYVCIHPGASVSARRWLPIAFAKTADALAAQGYQIVLTGTACEAELTQTVAGAMRFPAIDLAGKTDLGGLAVLLKDARLLVCNDTGVSHLAAALQVKSVVIFSNSDPKRWAPLDRQRHRVVDVRNASPLNPVWLHHMWLPQNSIHQVLEQAIELLSLESAYAS